MADDRYCRSCNVGCESQNTCQTCNSCQKCNSSTCEETCILVQSFCKTTGQSVGSFSFNQCIKQDETFLSKANWNRLISYINRAYAKGSEKDGGSSGLPSSDSNTFMTASMFNRVASALGGLGSSGPNLKTMVGGPYGDVILGSYFETLESYADALKYKTSQCDTCNASCDVTCKDCQMCNDNGNCGSCNGSCQSHSPSYGNRCETCNNCESTCEKSAQTTPDTGGDK